MQGACPPVHAGGPRFVGCRTDDGQSLPAGVSVSAALVRCVLPGPLTGPAQEIFPVLFTIEQTLPLFPASIGYARWVPTTPTGNLKWEYSMASAQILALGPFLFCADHLVLKRLALGIVLRKPRRRGFSVREDLKMIGSSTSLLVSSVDPSCGQTSGPDLLGERRGAGTAHFRGARGLVPEASSKIHGVRNRSYSEA